MARSLGKAIWPDGTERFLIHCDTANYSFARLFPTADEAKRTYRDGGLDALMSRNAALDLQVVKLALSGAWAFDGTEEMVVGLATSDRLVYCSDDDFSRDDSYSVQDIGGVLHLSKAAGGGFDGRYDASLCGDGEYNEAAKSLPLAALFGHSDSMCPACRANSLGLTAPAAV